MAGGDAPKTCATLLGRLRYRPPDQEAWGQFVERYGRVIYAWCRRCGAAAGRPSPDVSFPDAVRHDLPWQVLRADAPDPPDRGAGGGRLRVHRAYGAIRAEAGGSRWRACRDPPSSPAVRSRSPGR